MNASLYIDVSASMKYHYKDLTRLILHELATYNINNPYMLEAWDSINVIAYGEKAAQIFVKRSELESIRLEYQSSNLKNLGVAYGLAQSKVNLIITDGNPTDFIKVQNPSLVINIVIALGCYVSNAPFKNISALLTTNLSNAMNLFELYSHWYISAFCDDTFVTFQNDCYEKIKPLLYIERQ